MRVEQKLDFGPVQGIRIGHAPLGKPLMTVICYQLDNILIDTGPANARTSVLKMLNKQALNRIYLTHYHEDHAGNAAFLNQHLNLDVLGSEMTAGMLARHIRLKLYEIYMWGELTPLAIQVVGERFETNRYSFKVISTPGHSHDHVVYLEENEGWLFSGDMFLGGRIKYFRKDEDLVTTIKSLKAIGSLDFGKLFCGHNPQMHQPIKAIQRKINFLEGILEEVRYYYGLGWTDKAIINRLLNGKESWAARLVTLGDVSYRNLLLSALKGAKEID